MSARIHCQQRFHQGIVLITCFLLNIQSSFSLVAIGIFIVEFIEYFPVRKADVTLIGSLNIGVSIVVGLISTHVMRFLGRRKYGVIAACLQSVGFLSSAFINNVYFLYFSLGLMQGSGGAMYFILSNLTSHTFFTSRRALASGIVLTAFSVGSFIWPPFCRWLIDAYCWQGALVVLAAIQVQYIVFILFIPINISNTKKRKSCGTDRETRSVTKTIGDSECQKEELEKLKSPALSHDGADMTPEDSCREEKTDCAWSTGCACSTISWLPYSVCYACVVFFASVMHIGVISYLPTRVWELGYPKQHTSLLLSVFGITGTLLRPVLSFLGDYRWMKRGLALGISMAALGLTTILTRNFSEHTMLIVFVLLHTVGISPYLAFCTMVCVDISGLQHAEASLSMFIVGRGVGSVVLHALAGVLLDMGGDATDLFLLFGISGVMSGTIALSIIAMQRLHKPREPQK